MAGFEYNKSDRLVGAGDDRILAHHLAGLQDRRRWRARSAASLTPEGRPAGIVFAHDLADHNRIRIVLAVRLRFPDPAAIMIGYRGQIGLRFESDAVDIPNAFFNHEITDLLRRNRRSRRVLQPDPETARRNAADSSHQRRAVFRVADRTHDDRVCKRCGQMDRGRIAADFHHAEFELCGAFDKMSGDGFVFIEKNAGNGGRGVGDSPFPMIKPIPCCRNGLYLHRRIFRKSMDSRGRFSRSASTRSHLDRQIPINRWDIFGCKRPCRSGRCMGAVGNRGIPLIPGSRIQNGNGNRCICAAGNAGDSADPFVSSVARLAQIKGNLQVVSIRIGYGRLQDGSPGDIDCVVYRRNKRRLVGSVNFGRRRRQRHRVCNHSVGAVSRKIGPHIIDRSLRRGNADPYVA